MGGSRPCSFNAILFEGDLDFIEKVYAAMEEILALEAPNLYLPVRIDDDYEDWTWDEHPPEATGRVTYRIEGDKGRDFDLFTEALAERFPGVTFRYVWLETYYS